MGVLETINNSVDVNNTLQQTGEALNKFDWKVPFTWIGVKADALAGWVVQSSSNLGVNLGKISFKLLVLIILVGALLLSMHIGKKPVKIVFIVLIVLFIISVITSFFIVGL